MFYLIGLGLDKKSLSLEALEVLKKCKTVYLEEYTIEFPYSIKEIEKVIKKKVIKLPRKAIENEGFILDAKKKNIALLVYGSPLSATTHISLIMKAEIENIPCKIFHNASVFDAVEEVGLQVYKFGKTASIPLPKENYNPTSFLDVIKENKKSGSHTLILADIGLGVERALNALKPVIPAKERVVLCSRLGRDDSKIYYGTISALVKKDGKIKRPFCLIVPGKLHFLESDYLNKFKRI